MSCVLLVAQQQKGKILGASLNTLSAAKKLSVPVQVLFLGTGARAAAEEMLQYGVAGAQVIEQERFDKYLAADYAAQISSVAKSLQARAVFFAATSFGKDVAPRVAVALEAGQASDIIDINPDATYKRALFAGNLFADVSVETPVHVVTVRPSSFPLAERLSAVGQVSDVSAVDVSGGNAEVVSYEIAQAERPELTEAKVVVSGGRALGSAEKFKEVLYPLADTLGAAIGASRAAVDSGYAPNDWQVGQTGKVVAPQLYFAIGISGQIQHLAGMKDSKTIVAINKNPDEPIFQVADYGLVADLFQVVPELVTKLKT